VPAHLHVAGTLDALWALLDGWHDAMAAREMSSTTIEQREAYLLRFLRRTRSSPETVTEDVINRFLAAVNAKGSNRQAYVAALRGFYRWAKRRGYVEQDPTTELVARSPKYPPPDYFEPHEVRAILAAAARRRPTERVHAITLLFETGARIGSLAGVEARDVHGGMLHFRYVKNDRPYAVELTPAARRAVDALREARPTGPLIGVHKVTIWRWFHEAATDAGLPEGRRHPHLARHTFGTEVYERSQDPLLTMEALGHANLSTVHRYARVKSARRAAVFRRSLTG
jgi:site-specific recombinase XerD